MLKIKWIFSLSLLAFCLGSELSFAQRSNHIVLNDTIFSEGYVKQDQENINTSVFFRKKRFEPWVKYSIDEVNEYYISYTKYLRRNLPQNGSKEQVFLKLIPTRFEGYQLLMSLEKKEDFYLESKEGLQRVGVDFREILREIVQNPELEPLLEITNFKAYDIAYLLNTAGTFGKPRTYSRSTSIGIFAGTSSVSNQILIPMTNEISTINGTAKEAGVNLEIYMNNLRNISLVTGATVTKVTLNQFLQLRSLDTSYEVDAFLDYSVVQVPVQARYHADIIPNSWRGYIEMGYGISFLSKSPYYLKVGELRGNEVITYQREYEMGGTYHGIIGGLGIEKVLPKSKAIVLGFKFSSQTTDQKEKISTTTGFLGFKF